MISSVRICNRCKIEKPLEDFHRNKSRSGLNGFSRRCKQCAIKQATIWAVTHREQKNATNAAWKRAHRTQVSAATKIYRHKREMSETFLEERREKRRNYYRLNHSMLLESRREYRAAHPEHHRAENAIRKARKRLALIKERVYRNVVWQRDKGTCHICLGKCDSTFWHLDHITPLARGGVHAYSNVAVSHPHCNTSKKARLMEEMEAKINVA